MPALCALGPPASRCCRRFPPTDIVCGGLDPLLDDAIDFNTRLRRLGVAGELVVHRALPHGFLNFAAVPAAAAGIASVRECVLGRLGVGSGGTGSGGTGGGE